VGQESAFLTRHADAAVPGNTFGEPLVLGSQEAGEVKQPVTWCCTHHKPYLYTVLIASQIHRSLGWFLLTALFVYLFFKILFIYLTERDTAREGTQAGGVGEGEAGFPLSRESNAGLNPRTLGS